MKSFVDGCPKDCSMCWSQTTRPVTSSSTELSKQGWERLFYKGPVWEVFASVWATCENNAQVCGFFGGEGLDHRANCQEEKLWLIEKRRGEKLFDELWLYVSERVWIHYIFVYINIVNAVFTCTSEWMTQPGRCFCKVRTGSWFSENTFYSKHLQPKLSALLPTPPINLNKCHEWKKKKSVCPSPLMWISVRLCMISCRCLH